MRLKSRFHPSLCVLLLVYTLTFQKTGFSFIISGKVTDGVIPIAGAVVEARQADSIIKTTKLSNDGKYSLELPVGTYAFKAYAKGYFPETIIKQLSTSQNVDFSLKRTPVVKPTVVNSDFWSESTKLDNQLIQIGDVITAVDTNGIVAGVCNVEFRGAYLLHVYGDDISTKDIVEGAIEGDTITFFINEKKAKPEGIWHASASAKLDLESVSEIIVPRIVQTAFISDFWSDNATLDSQPVRRGDVITARDPNGVICGICTVEYEGAYLTHVYGDDPSTSNIDEGAVDGDVITFYVNTYKADSSKIPRWLSHGSQRLDLAAVSKGKIPYDVNNDNQVDLSDLALVGKHLGEKNAKEADINGDGVVDILDLVIIGIHFGERIQP